MVAAVGQARASVVFALAQSGSASRNSLKNELHSELFTPSFTKALTKNCAGASCIKYRRHIDPVCHLNSEGDSKIDSKSSEIQKRLIDGGKARRNCRHKDNSSIPRRNLLLGATAGMFSVLCPICGTIDAAKADEWTYGDLSGPPNWSNLCAVGTGQSPIDIPLGSSGLATNDFGELKFNYSAASPSFLNTGHGTMQVNYPEGSNFFEVGGRKFELLQYHFHSPSEHTFNGARTAMEAHLVHRDENGKLGVVGVMLEGVPSAPRNLCLQAALDFSPELKYKKIPAPVECFDEDPDAPPPVRKICFMLEINPARLLPKGEDAARKYFHYQGSLTTPPCSEGVDWFLLEKTLKVPDTQVIEFMRYVGAKKSLAMNYRPIQPLGERTLYYNGL